MLYDTTALIFLSTLSLRRATWRGAGYPPQLPDFYPRSPCGERHQFWRIENGCVYFYPRSPCGERQSWATRARAAQLFLSTLSLRRATGLRWTASCASVFLSTLSLRRATRPMPLTPCALTFLSTLSLRRATACGNLRAPTVPDFYPRSPCGERLGFYADMMALTAISIHALLAESDRQRRR